MRVREKIYFVIGAIWIICLCVSAFTTADAAEDGAALYKRACIGCHGADGSSTSMGISQAVKGQSSGALYQKLTGYQAGTFGGGRANVMQNVIKSYSAEQLKALADAMSRL